MRGGSRTPTIFRPRGPRPRAAAITPLARCSLGGGSRTHVFSLPKRAGQPLPYTQVEQAGEVESPRARWERAMRPLHHACVERVEEVGSSSQGLEGPRTTVVLHPRCGRSGRRTRLAVRPYPLSKRAVHLARTLHQSGRRGSDPRPSTWQADALPAELLPHGGEEETRTPRTL